MFEELDQAIGFAELRAEELEPGEKIFVLEKSGKYMVTGCRYSAEAMGYKVVKEFEEA